MGAYILFTESVICFTPNATTMNDHEHVTINAAASRPVRRQRQRNTNTGQQEIAVHIPTNFIDEKFWIIITIGRKASQKVWLEVCVEDGIIAAVTVIDGNPEELSLVDIKFPSGEWATDSIYEWYRYPIPSANSSFLWLP